MTGGQQMLQSGKPAAPPAGPPPPPPPPAPLSVSLDKTTAYGFGNISTVTSETVSATPAGGTSPYTYQWAWVSGGASIATLNATSAATAFRGTNMAEGEIRTGTARLTVTDAAAATVQSSNVSVTVERGAGGSL